MPENPREKLYNNLLSTKKVTPDEIGDFQTFDKMLDTPDGATKLHSNLIKNGIATEDQIGDADTFAQQVKKKELSAKSEPSTSDSKTPSPLLQKSGESNLNEIGLPKRPVQKRASGDLGENDPSVDMTDSKPITRSGEVQDLIRQDENKGGIWNNFNTVLGGKSKDVYENISKKLKLSDHERDYDMRGWVDQRVHEGKSQDAIIKELTSGAHFPDTFKKPNHPTFSDQSQYHNEKTKGGKWVQEGENWSFVPSEHNVKNLGEEGLRNYFKEREPNSRLLIGGKGFDKQGGGVKIPSFTEQIANGTLKPPKPETEAEQIARYGSRAQMMQVKARRKAVGQPTSLDRTFDVIRNAIDQGSAQGDVENTFKALYDGATPEELKAFAEANKRIEKIQTHPSVKKFEESEGTWGWVSAFAENPMDIALHLMTKSTTSLLKTGGSAVAEGITTGAVGGATVGTMVTPAIGTAAGFVGGASAGLAAGMAKAGFDAGMASDMVQSMKDSGIDIKDPKSVEKALKDKDKMDAWQKHALKYNIPIAAFDLFSAGLGGKIFAPAKSVGSKIAKGIAETAIQAGLDASGEAAGQLAADKRLDAKGIFSEVAGGLPQQAVEVATGMLNNEKPINAISDKGEQSISNAIQYKLAQGEIASKKAEILASLEPDGNGGVIMTPEAKAELDKLENARVQVQEPAQQSATNTEGEKPSAFATKQQEPDGKPASTEANKGATVESAVIEIGGETFEGKNHAEAILKAQQAGKDISQVDRQGEGMFKLSDGTVISREQAKETFGADKAEMLITQDEAANKANDDYEKVKTEFKREDIANKIASNDTGGIANTPIEDVPLLVQERTNPTENVLTVNPIQENITLTVPQPTITGAQEQESTTGVRAVSENVQEAGTTDAEGVSVGQENTDTQDTLDNAEYQPRSDRNVILRLPIDKILGIQEFGENVARGQNGVDSRINRIKEFLKGKPKKLEASLLNINKDNTLGIDGRHRLEAAKEMGATHAMFEIKKSDEQALRDLINEQKEGEQNKITNEPTKEQDVQASVLDQSGATDSDTEKGTRKVEKTILTKRAYSGNFREGAKRELEKYGLDRPVANNDQSILRAKKILKDLGEDVAFEAVKGDLVKGSVQAALFNELIELQESKMIASNDDAEISELYKKQAELVNFASEKATEGGQYNQIWGKIYQDSNLYNLRVQTEKYKKMNGGVIPSDIEQKFKEYDEKIKELDKKIAEANEKTKEKEAHIAILELQDAEQKATNEKTIAAKKQAAKKKVSDGLSEMFGAFASITGGKLSAVDSDEKIIRGARKAIEGFMEEASITFEEAFNKLKEAVKSKGYNTDKLDEIRQNLESESTQSDKKESLFGLGNKKLRELAMKVEMGKDVTPEQQVKQYVELIKNEISETHEGITDREIRDEISGYGKVITQSKEDGQKELSKMKNLFRGVSQLEDIGNGEPPKKSGFQREPTDTDVRLIFRRVREALKTLPLDPETKEGLLKTAEQSYLKRLTNRIEDLKKENATRIRVKKEKNQPLNSKDITDAKDIIAELEKEHSEIFRDELENEKTQAKLKASKSALNKRIADLEKKIATNDFSKRKITPLIADNELTRLRAQKEALKEKYDDAFAEYEKKNRSKWQKILDGIGDAWQLPRVSNASMDASFMGVQGKRLMLDALLFNRASFIEATKNMLKIMSSEKRAEQFINNIKAQEWYDLAKESKLSITKTNASPSLSEEGTYAGWTELAWDVIGASVLPSTSKPSMDKWRSMNPFKAFERASVGFLDTLRIAKFLEGVEKLKSEGLDIENNKQAYKDVADYVNTVSGRASLGAGERFSKQLTSVFYSPRNWASTIKNTTPYAFYHYGKMRSGATGWKPSVAQKLAIQTFATKIGYTIGMVSLASIYLNNDDDEDTGVSFDSRSKDFLKIRLKGGVVFDPWGGAINMTIFMSQIIHDLLNQKAYVKDGKEYYLGMFMSSPTSLELVERQVLNKVNPTMSFIVERASVKRDKEGNMYSFGQKYDVGGEAMERITPMIATTIKELYNNDPSIFFGIKALAAFEGESFYVPKKKEEKGEKDKKSK